MAEETIYFKRKMYDRMLKWKNERMYILIKKYPTFQFKSIPLTTMNGFYPFLTNDKYVYKTGNHY